MSEAHRLGDQMRLAYDGDAWHGPSLVSLLDQVPVGRAHDQVIPGAHSVAELVQHMAFWKEVVRRRTEGDAVADANQRDWRHVDPATATWDVLRARLHQAHHDLVLRVEGLTDARLEESVPGQAISLYVMLHGVVQHDVYHAGQVAMLLKTLGVTP